MSESFADSTRAMALGAAAGRKMHHQPDEPVRPVLRLRAADDGGGQHGVGGRRDQVAAADHVALLRLNLTFSPASLTTAAHLTISVLSIFESSSGVEPTAT